MRCAPSIDSRHLVLGLVDEGEGVAFQVLTDLGATQAKLSEAVGKNDAQMLSGHVPFTPECKRLLEFSLRDALQLGHKYIGTEHMLLAVTRVPDGPAAELLDACGVDVNSVRPAVIEKLSAYAPPVRPTETPRRARSKHEHGYVSTACHHRIHHECRATCKWCESPCGCSCHGEEA